MPAWMKTYLTLAQNEPQEVRIHQVTSLVTGVLQVSVCYLVQGFLNDLLLILTLKIRLLHLALYLTLQNNSTIQTGDQYNTHKCCYGTCTHI